MELRPDESLFRTTKSSYVSFVVRQGALVVCGPCKSVAAREICRWDASIWRPDRPDSAGRAALAGYWSLNSESISCEHFAAINCVRIPTVAVGFSRVGASGDVPCTKPMDRVRQCRDPERIKIHNFLLHDPIQLQFNPYRHTAAGDWPFRDQPSSECAIFQRIA